MSAASLAGSFTYAVQPTFEYNPAGQNMGIVFGRGPGAGRGGAGGAGGRGVTGRRWRCSFSGCGEYENVSPEVAAARAAAAAAAAAATAPPAPAVPAAKQRPALKSIGPDSNGGFLVAYDAATTGAAKRWRVPGGSAIGGGTVATGGGLVFQATNGTLYAYSADKGEKLLELKVGISGGMAPPITFMLDGKQYVALQVGQGAPVSGTGR